jgi:hypothetical protein
MIVKRTIGKDGRIIEEYIDPETGERRIVETTIDANGRKIVKETKISKDGKVTVTNKEITIDKDGNEIVKETYIDPKTGKQVTVEKIIKKDKYGNEYTEERHIDADGNVINVKTTTKIDKDGNKVTVKEIIGVVLTFITFTSASICLSSVYSFPYLSFFIIFSTVTCFPVLGSI